MNLKIFLTEIDIGRNKVTMDICEFKRLSKLAEIGMATERAFSEQSCVLFIDSMPDVNECYEFEFTDTNQLLEWAEDK